MSAPVFVVGSGRSGTTIVDKCIGSHSEFCSFPFEPQLLSCPNIQYGIFQLLTKEQLSSNEVEKIIGYLGRRYKFSARGGKELGFYQWMSWKDYMRALNPLRSLGDLGKVERVQSAREFLRNVYSPWTSKNFAKDWVDGGPMNGRLIKEILSIYPEARFVHVIRNGMDVANSFVRLGWAGGSFNQAAQFWANQVISTQLLGRSYAGDNYIEVRFEDIVYQPKIELGRLFEFLNAEVAEEFLDDLSGKINAKRASTYKKEVDPEKEEYIEIVSRCIL